jgi:serine/threonine-protein kinase
MAAKQFDQACPKFEESQRLDSGIGTMYNLADCWEHSGRTASAWSMFLDAAAAAHVAGQGERERAAKDRAAALEPKLSHLTIQVASVDPGLEVRRDGHPVGQASFATAVPVDPGLHRIDVSAPGKKRFATNIEVGATASVQVQIPKLQNGDGMASESSGAVGTALPAPGSDGAKASRSNVLPYTLIGVGVVGVAVTAVFGLKSRSANSDALALCPSGAACTQGDIDRHDLLVTDAKSDRTLAIVGLGVSAVSLVTAAIVLATGHSAPAASAWNFRFDAGQRQASAVAEGRF